MLLAAAALLASGCKHVEPAPGASEVRVISADEANRPSCRRLGETLVEVPAKVGFVSRGKDKVAAELETMARNSAVGLEGNAVAPVGEVEEGKREYGIYRCH
ncbi:MAG: DUF4156 domain-containing protein [Deltaproteobacteria bacterium]|nr:DUF4156 domain-containing protein [Deltaproteobacteria bacterium]MBW2417471.1 DUF4156 domain-containing protein [Deltaproteobacteria bacterium]